MKTFEGKNVIINEDRAVKVFALLADAWRKRSGLYRSVIFPEDRITYPDDARQKANWLFWMVHFMRGGIVSDDAINMFGIMAELRPEVFDPYYLAKAGPEEIIELIRAANQVRLIRLGQRDPVPGEIVTQGDLDFPMQINEIAVQTNGNVPSRLSRRKTLGRDAGTIGYKLQEHAPNLIHNAQVLCNRFGGDARNFFRNPGGSYVKTFEQFFIRIDHEKRENKGIVGMRRKIAALFQMWLQKFSLIPEKIPCPLVVDFHLLRILYSTGIIHRFKKAKLLKQSKKRTRDPFPDALLGKTVVRVGDDMREEVMAWSTKFLGRMRKHFNSSELSLAMWILSRELCPSHAQTKSLKKRTRYIFYDEIARDVHLQHAHPSLCGFCPVQRYCTGTFSSGPHYEYGLLVLQKRFDYSTIHLPGIDLSEFLRPIKSGAKRGSRY